MPALAGGEDERRRPRSRLDLGDRRGEHARLDLAPLGVEARRAAARDRAASAGSSVASSRGAEIGAADPAAGIDARPEDEAGVIGVEPLVDPRDVGERGDAGIAAPLHHLQPLRHQRAVEPGERHHVADRAERDEVEPLQEIGLGPAAIPAGARAARG